MSFQASGQTFEEYFNIKILHGVYIVQKGSCTVKHDELSGNVVPLIKSSQGKRYYSYIDPSIFSSPQPIKCSVNSIVNLYGLEDLPLRNGDIPIDMTLIGKYQKTNSVIVRFHQIIREKNTKRKRVDTIMLERSALCELKMSNVSCQMLR